MANRYWVGGSATWDATNTAVWSDSAGGAGGQSVPTAGDNVYFSANTPYTVTLSGNLACYDLIIAGTNSAQITFLPAASYTLNCSGPDGSASYVTFRGAFPTAGNGKITCSTGVNVLSTSPTRIARISNFIGNYNYAIILTSGTSFTTPSYVPAINSIEMIGGGGSASSGWRSTALLAWGIGAGGGGGGYTKLSNVPLAPSTTYSYMIGQGGSIMVIPAGAASIGGMAGQNTTITIDGTTYIASGGSGGPMQPAGTNTAAGGPAQTLGGLITASYPGGAGGAGNAIKSVMGTYYGGGSGGGGAGGPYGAGGSGGRGNLGSLSQYSTGGGGGAGGGGGNGTNGTTSNGIGGTGYNGSGSGGNGGRGSTYQIKAGNGGTGAEWFGVWGSGGGPGGHYLNGSYIDPGLYGSGGAGGGAGATVGGSGAPGIIVIQLAFANVLASDVESPTQNAANTGLGFLQIMGLRR